MWCSIRSPLQSCSGSQRVIGAEHQPVIRFAPRLARPAPTPGGYMIGNFGCQSLVRPTTTPWVAGRLLRQGCELGGGRFSHFLSRRS